MLMRILPRALEAREPSRGLYIVVNLHHAYRRPEFRDRHYASFHTGPSATADIKGVLIHGAQGVRSLSVLPLARAAGTDTH
jgi:L-lactate dehydrogenase complex protein LldG